MNVSSNPILSLVMHQRNIKAMKTQQCVCISGLKRIKHGFKISHQLKDQSLSISGMLQ